MDARRAAKWSRAVKRRRSNRDADTLAATTAAPAADTSTHNAAAAAATAANHIPKAQPAPAADPASPDARVETPVVGSCTGAGPNLDMVLFWYLMVYLSDPANKPSNPD